jgi:mannose-6-phosphate isomerase-like protein (cupin superfamily)
MRTRLVVLAALTLFAGGSAAAQGMPRSTDGTDPKTWDPALDAVKSGARNHVVIYEDKEIRVLSVTVQPGEVEAVHHHQWPSVIVFVNYPPAEDRDAGGKLQRVGNRGDAGQELPVVARIPPEAAHSVTNTGTTPLRLIRVEYKNGFPTGPAK